MIIHSITAASNRRNPPRSPRCGAVAAAKPAPARVASTPHPPGLRGPPRGEAIKAAEKQQAAAGPAIVAAFRGGASVTDIARRFARSRNAIEWVLKKAGLKRNDHRRPRGEESGEAERPDRARSARRQDLAFQKAMRRAIRAGSEHPPMIGAFKDPRPLAAPRLFEPAAHSSGCTSPAQECADLVLQEQTKNITNR